MQPAHHRAASEAWDLSAAMRMSMSPARPLGGGRGPGMRPTCIRAGPRAARGPARATTTSRPRSACRGQWTRAQTSWSWSRAPTSPSSRTAGARSRAATTMSKIAAATTSTTTTRHLGPRGGLHAPTRGTSARSAATTTTTRRAPTTTTRRAPTPSARGLGTPAACVPMASPAGDSRGGAGMSSTTTTRSRARPTSGRAPGNMRCVRAWGRD
mmetsp:Transcript_93792/g.260625  ORF Transcript_93792/g.260625 Transcript_93792/m.260625 type:complete len:212 (-) Transcript_93792:34-669(-)